MNRVRLLVFNAALGVLDYRVPDGMAIEPARWWSRRWARARSSAWSGSRSRLATDEVPDSKLGR